MSHHIDIGGAQGRGNPSVGHDINAAHAIEAAVAEITREHLELAALAAVDGLATAVPDGCGRCHTCAPNKIGGPIRMIVCPECGNKRCPKANDCRNACTGSNEPGQPGSAYPAAPTITERQCCGSLENGPHKMGCDYKMR